MVLKEWAEVRNLYNTCRPRLRKTIFTPSRMICYWYLWAATTLFALSSLVPFFGLYTEKPIVGLVGFGLVLVFSWLLHTAKERALTREFKNEYEKYGLDSYPLLQRLSYLRYAFFLRGLLNQGYSREDIEKLQKISETIDLPKLPDVRPSQYPLVVFLVLWLSGLCIDYIKQLSLWKNTESATYILIHGASLLAFVIMIFTIYQILINQPKYKHQEIQRFLQWAEKDMEEGHRVKVWSRRAEVENIASK
jgi:hypothetical protein